ncbi:MAG: PadR family transcriptional regulator [Acidobacteria bacterium]|nr:PadR family transcriptional regulator [Acidobacteriota bacterium]
MRSNWFHVLAALASDNLHGSAIADDVLQQTGGALRLWPATLYRTLDQMVEEGLIEELKGTQHPSGESQKRRYYTATAQGRRELAEAAERLSSFAATARDRLEDRGR